MADLTMPQRELKFNISGTIFPIRKAHLLERLGLFQEDPSRLNAAEYEVKTRVPPALFADFIRMIEGVL
jgi:hypothetical protein